MQLSNLRGVITAAALGAICVAGVLYAIHVPAPIPASAPATAFSSDRAMQHVRAMAERPHPIGSDEERKVGTYILNTLISMGIVASIQEATGVGTRDAVAGRVHNIVGTLTGLLPGTPKVVLVAHYDGVAAGPAAGDDASGSAVLLETLRALRAGPPLKHDVTVVFTDGEEAGLLGAAAYVRERRTMQPPIGVVLNFEARGTHGPSLMFETGTGNLDVVRVLRGVRGARATSLSTAVYRRLPNDTDLSEFAMLDVPAMNFAFIGGVNRYHTAEDDVAHLDPRSLQHHGNQALALARAFANGPMPRPRTSDAVFFDLPVIGLVLYPQSWALPIALIALVLVIVAVVRLRRREPLPRWLPDVLLGAGGTVLSIVAAGVVAFVFATILRPLHAALPRGGAPAWSGIYAAALTLFVFATAGLIYAIVRRRAGALGAYIGALCVWALIAVLVTAASPGFSFVFTWPLLLAAAALTVGSLRPALATILLWVVTIVALFFLVPTIYLMVCSALGLDEAGAVILAIFAALGTWLLAPHVESMRGTGWRNAPVIAAVVALLLVVVGLFTVRNNAKHPTGGSFVYAVDADSGTAWLTGYASSAYSAKWFDRTLTRSSTERPPPGWLTRTYGVRGIPAPMATGPQAAAEVTVLSDTSTSGTRTVTLQIRAAAGTLGLSMASDGAQIQSATVDGVPVDTSRYRFRRSRWSLFYAAPPTTGITLALTMPAFAHPTLSISARYAGIPALSGFQMPKRPEGIIPFQSGDITLVYKRVPL